MVNIFNALGTFARKVCCDLRVRTVFHFIYKCEFLYSAAFEDVFSFPGGSWFSLCFNLWLGRENVQFALILYRPVFHEGSPVS